MYMETQIAVQLLFEYVSRLIAFSQENEKFWDIGLRAVGGR